MFSWLFKSRLDKMRERFSKELHFADAAITTVISGQIDAVVYFEKISRKQLLEDPFTTLYIFGIYNAIGSKWGTDIRAKIGIEICELCFLKFVSAKFEIQEIDAKTYFKKALEAYQKESPNKIIYIGETDGALAFRNAQTTGLINHFTKNDTGPVSITAEQVREFQQYRLRQTDRLIENAQKYKTVGPESVVERFFQ